MDLDRLIEIFSITMISSLFLFILFYVVLKYEYAAWFFAIAFIVAYALTGLVEAYAHKVEKNKKWSISNSVC